MDFSMITIKSWAYVTILNSGMPSLSVVADKPDLQAKIVNVTNTTLAGLRDVYVVEVELDRQTNLYASGYYSVCLNARFVSKYTLFDII